MGCDERPPPGPSGRRGGAGPAAPGRRPPRPPRRAAPYGKIPTAPTLPTPTSCPQRLGSVPPSPHRRSGARLLRRSQGRDDPDGAPVAPLVALGRGGRHGPGGRRVLALLGLSRAHRSADALVSGVPHDADPRGGSTPAGGSSGPRSGRSKRGSPTDLGGRAGGSAVVGGPPRPSGPVPFASSSGELHRGVRGGRPCGTRPRSPGTGGVRRRRTIPGVRRRGRSLGGLRGARGARVDRARSARSEAPTRVPRTRATDPPVRGLRPTARHGRAIGAMQRVREPSVCLLLAGFASGGSGASLHRVPLGAARFHLVGARPLPRRSTGLAPVDRTRSIPRSARDLPRAGPGKSPRATRSRRSRETEVNSTESQPKARAARTFEGRSSTNTGTPQRTGHRADAATNALRSGLIAPRRNDARRTPNPSSQPRDRKILQWARSVFENTPRGTPRLLSSRSRGTSSRRSRARRSSSLCHSVLQSGGHGLPNARPKSVQNARRSVRPAWSSARSRTSTVRTRRSGRSKRRATEATVSPSLHRTTTPPRSKRTHRPRGGAPAGRGEHRPPRFARVSLPVLLRPVRSRRSTEARRTRLVP